MKQIELSAGTIEYSDTGSDRPVLVLLHRLMMDAALWDGPMADLSADHRCVAPTLPLGAHRHAIHADADLSLPKIARLVAEVLDRSNTAQQANPARISITRRAREYIPGLTGEAQRRHRECAPDRPRPDHPQRPRQRPVARRPGTGTSASTGRTHHEDASGPGHRPAHLVRST